jgi:hypothetical protein
VCEELGWVTGTGGGALIVWLFLLSQRSSHRYQHSTRVCKYPDAGTRRGSCEWSESTFTSLHQVCPSTEAQTPAESTRGVQKERIQPEHIFVLPFAQSSVPKPGSERDFLRIPTRKVRFPLPLGQSDALARG